MSEIGQSATFICLFSPGCFYWWKTGESYANRTRAGGQTRIVRTFVIGPVLIHSHDTGDLRMLRLRSIRDSGLPPLAESCEKRCVSVYDDTGLEVSSIGHSTGGPFRVVF